MINHVAAKVSATLFSLILPLATDSFRGDAYAGSGVGDGHIQAELR